MLCIHKVLIKSIKSQNKSKQIEKLLVNTTDGPMIMTFMVLTRDNFEVLTNTQKTNALALTH